MRLTRRGGARARHARKGRITARWLLAALVVVAVGAAWLVTFSGGGKVRQARAPDGAEHRSVRGSGVNRRGVTRALEQGVRAAAALGGSVEAATMLDSWREPAVAASLPGDAERWMRMWSMSKVVTMVALLRAMGWGQRRGEPLPPEVRQALEAAITRSENCPQRRIVLELQDINGGGAQGAREAVAETLREAGAEAHVSTEVEGPEVSCLKYLESQKGIPDPLAPTGLLGTSTWRVQDAVRFMDAIGSGVYGKAVAKRVLSEMRIPKARSREVLPTEFTAAPDWGAGRALTALHPAYKAGWGGTQQGEFMAGQLALVELPDGERVAIAAMFHPDVQPAVDDPGLTAAPEALELAMGAVADELQANPPGRGR